MNRLSDDEENSAENLKKQTKNNFVKHWEV